MKVVKLSREQGEFLTRFDTGRYKPTKTKDADTFEILMPDDEARVIERMGVRPVTSFDSVATTLSTLSVIKLPIANVPVDANAEHCKKNLNAVTVYKISDNEYKITGNLANMDNYASLVESQGTHYWVTIVLQTGIDLLSLKWNGTALTATDKAEAVSHGYNDGKTIILKMALENGMQSVKITNTAASKSTILTFGVEY